MFWSRKSAPVEEAPSVLKLDEPNHEMNQQGWIPNSLLNSNAPLNAYPGAMQSHPSPLDVYGCDPEPPEAYTLGDFAKLENMLYYDAFRFLDLHGNASPVSMNDMGQWRYALVPKSKHKCCPDCGLDRLRVEELETRLLALAAQEQIRVNTKLTEVGSCIDRVFGHSKAIAIQEMNDRIARASNALIEARIAPLETETSAVKRRLELSVQQWEQWSKEGFAPGAFGEIARLADALKASDDATAKFLCDQAEATKALRCDLEQLIRATGCERHTCPEIPAKSAIPAMTVIRKIVKTK